jgi:putative transcriptional regulator
MSGLALVVACWLASPTPVPLPPTPEAPGIGAFLVANPQIEGYFAETVIVLVDHDTGGTLGVIVNRPVALSLDELLPEIEEARGHGEPAYLGGPVHPGKMLLLIRAKEAPRHSAPVLPGLHMSGHRDALRKLLGEPAEAVSFRAYAGYAGWAPGQLAGEIARGDWTLAPGDADSIFTPEPAPLWRKLLERHREIHVHAPQKFINLSRPWRSAAASSASRTSGRARSSTH